jgi:hypothetical protein
VSFGRRLPTLDLVLVLGALLIGILGYLEDDRTGWNHGYGWDGREYGSLAEHFPGGVGGSVPVTPPGYGPPPTPVPNGLDTYYIGRIFPSGLVWATLQVLRLSATHAHVVATFAAWDAVCLAAVVLAWCMAANRLELRIEAKLFGVAALVVNYAVLKTSSYWPVLTDMFAYALGALSIWFWLARKQAALVVATVLVGFTWPSELFVGAALIAFPPRTPALLPPRRAWYRPVAGLAVGVVSLVALYDHRSWVQAPGVFPHAHAYLLGILASAAFAGAAAAWLMPDVGIAEWRTVSVAASARRIALAVAVVVAVDVGQHVLAQRQGITLQALLWQGVERSATWPASFLVALFGYFGPMLVLALLLWPAVARVAQAFGIGALVGVVVFLVNCLLAEPRKAIALYPLVVLLTVIALERYRLGWRALASFAVVSLAVSRVWLHIGRWPYISDQDLTRFPAAKFYMTTPAALSRSMYLLHLVCSVAAIAAVIALRRRSAGEVVANRRGNGLDLVLAHAGEDRQRHE